MKEKVIKFCDRTIEICLYLLIFCLPFAKAGLEIFASIAIFAWVIKKFTSYKLQVRSYISSTELNKALTAFVIVNALAVIISINFKLSIRAFFSKILEYIILYFIVTETINNRRLRNILIVLVLSISLILTDAIIQYFGKVDFLRSFPFGRLRASFPSANDFAGWLVMLIPIFLGILVIKQAPSSRSRIKKIFLGGLVILMLICLGLTYSRGAWIGFLVGLSFISIYKTINFLTTYQHKKLVDLFIIVCLIGIFFILPYTMKERIKSVGNINLNLNRINLWKESLSIIEDFPVLGSGLNTYTVVAPNYKIQEGGGIYPHNSFLQMAAETGILGLVCFLWIVVELFKLGIQTIKKKKDILLLGILVGILGFLVHSFFDTNFYALQLAVLFWFMMGLTVAKTKID